MSQHDQPPGERAPDEQDFSIPALAERLTDFRRQNYYERLGVGQGDSVEDLKTAYKRLSKKYHPDVHKQRGPAEQAMIDEMAHLITECNVLTDPVKRALYDRNLAVGKERPIGQESGRQSADRETALQFSVLDEMVRNEGRERRNRSKVQECSHLLTVCRNFLLHSLPGWVKEFILFVM